MKTRYSIIGQTIEEEEVERINPIFGWRYYNVARCPFHNIVALRGQRAGIIHQSLTPEAICSQEENLQLWCTEHFGNQRLILHSKESIPVAKCSCGYYVSKQPRVDYKGLAAVYCQLLGHAQEHEYGYRVKQVRLVAGFLPKLGAVPGWSHSFGMTGMPVNETATTLTGECFERLGIPFAGPENAAMIIHRFDMPIDISAIY